LVEHATGWRFVSRIDDISDAGVALQRAVVETFSAAGDSLETRSFEIEAPSGPGVGPLLVAVRGGVAIARPQTPPDGGLLVVVTRYDTDGGQVLAEVPFEPGLGLLSLRLAEVGEALHLIRQNALRTELVALSQTGDILARRAVPSSISVQPGPDSIRVGAELLSPSLAPLVSRASEPTGSEVVAWSLSERRWSVATLQEGAVLVDPFTFDAPASAPRRVSEGTEVLAVGLATGGAGVLFGDDRFQGNQLVRSTWFAALDPSGTKRGPDVHVGGQAVGPAGIADVGASTFGVFLPTPSGLIHRLVRCE
jgi:hypothetical protein